MFVKLFVGVLGEVKHAGLVLVHDRPGFHKILVCVVAISVSVVLLLVVTCEYLTIKTTTCVYSS